MADISIAEGPYEVLVRFGPDFKVKAAHVQFARVITIDGIVEKWEPKAAAGLPVHGEFAETVEELALGIGHLDMKGEMAGAIHDTFAAVQFEVKEKVHSALADTIDEIHELSGFNRFHDQLKVSLENVRGLPRDIPAIDISERGATKLTVLARLKTLVGLG